MKCPDCEMEVDKLVHNLRCKKCQVRYTNCKHRNIEYVPLVNIKGTNEYNRAMGKRLSKEAKKSKVKELLATDEYKKLMKKRSTEWETVFGQIKSNQHFRRFHLRGNEKVATEWGLLMIGYDFKQLIRLSKV